MPRISTPCIDPLSNHLRTFLAEMGDINAAAFTFATSGIQVVRDKLGRLKSLPSDEVAAVAAGAVCLNNLLLSGLIAFRIFTMSREVVAYLGPRARNMYRTVIAATLESGLFYSMYLGVLVTLEIVSVLEQQYLKKYGLEENYLQLSKIDALHDTRASFLRIWAPIAGITTTIIIVRVALGISLNDVKSTILTIQAAITIDEATPVIDISRQGPDLRDSLEDQSSPQETLNDIDIEARRT
ncbi:hypothetical protein Moror_5573 [Moniliophthora roreri MCA 2997]|uniref:Uncharacterized protein n=1 Tax=Moniliophthora roreri (strain MCA 2997) TaxID=1381753 RepID=V2X2Y0_MONRO|nr:hypothetical protein Moror_5573 [Moniliophthora roreri MCA 2997]